MHHSLTTLLCGGQTYEHIAGIGLTIIAEARQPLAARGDNLG